jgi:hypothetical protein
MRNLLVSGLFVLAACGGSSDNGITNPPPPKKPDPYVTVRVRDLMDTTTAPAGLTGTSMPCCPARYRPERCREPRGDWAQ